MCTSSLKMDDTFIITQKHINEIKLKDIEDYQRQEAPDLGRVKNAAELNRLT